MVSLEKVRGKFTDYISGRNHLTDLKIFVKESFIVLGTK
jgi:hypothetical protein